VVFLALMMRAWEQDPALAQTSSIFLWQQLLL
jgi:hypothetical protein